MSKALVILKNRGMGDICVLISSIHEVSRKIGKPVTVLAQKNTKAQEILKYDPHVESVIELDEKGIFNIVKKIKPQKFDKSYIYSDSVRLFLISKISGIKENFHYKFFSKKGKNFFKTAKEFTEKTLNTKINPQSKIYWNTQETEKIKRKFDISSSTKNIICGISASGPTKRWDIDKYIRLFEEINKKYKSRFFIAGGPDDQNLVRHVTNSSIGKNCISFLDMSISETMPIIASSQYYIGNDTGWGHISSGLGLKCLFLFMDSPPAAYGTYSKNISIVVPDGETIESCGHNTRGKDKIPIEKVLNKTIELIN